MLSIQLNQKSFAMIKQNKTKTNFEKIDYPKFKRVPERILQKLKKMGATPDKAPEYSQHIVYLVLNGHYQDLNVEIALKKVLIDMENERQEKLRQIQELNAQLS